MTFRLNNLNYNLPDLMRKIGYKPERYTQEGELAAVRPLGADFPRFHIYLRSDEKVITFNLHLDQKKSSYEGTAAHGGDYESETVRGEANRIKEIVFELA
jgi:hypothetical protein